MKSLASRVIVLPMSASFCRIVEYLSATANEEISIVGDGVSFFQQKNWI